MLLYTYNNIVNSGHLLEDTYIKLEDTPERQFFSSWVNKIGYMADQPINVHTQ